MIARATLVVPPDGVSVRSMTTGTPEGTRIMAASKAAMVDRSPIELLKRIVVMPPDALTASAGRSAE